MAHDEFVRQAGGFIAPEELVRLVAGEQQGLTKEDFFNSPEHQPVKDAWQGAVLSMGYQQLVNAAVHVRLSSQDQFPDFQLRANKVVHDFEAVMALNKPLGRAYRGDVSVGPVAAKRPQNVPVFEPGPLRTAVQKKAGKHYQGVVHLSVYLNFAGAGGSFDAVSRVVREAGGDKFESVWLIARGNESGAADTGAYFIACAKPSSLLAAAPGWLKVAGINGLNL